MTDNKNRPATGILGTKLGMTQVFDENNRVVPVTVIKAGPNVVTQVRTLERDGYSAVQIAAGQIKNPAAVAKAFVAAETDAPDAAAPETADSEA